MSKRDTSTQKTGNTTKKQVSVFKPLIASSLALALSSGIVSAASPTFHAKRWNGDDQIGNLTLSGVMWDDNSNVSILKTDNNATTIERINIVFSNNTYTNQSISGQTYTLRFFGNNSNGSSDHSQLTLNGNTQAIQVGSQGKGTLSIDLGPLNNNPRYRDFVLDLSQTTSGDFSYKGNLEVRTGSDGGTVQANFAKDMIGNITINNNGGYLSATNTFSFLNNASLQGNISATAGNTSLVLGNDINSNNQITGGITGRVGSPAYHQDIIVDIHFKGNGAIGGLISHDGRANGRGNGKINILFDGNGVISNGIETAASNNADSGHIIVTFSKNGTIENINSSAGLNEVKFNGGAGTTNQISNIIANSGGNNQVTLSNDTEVSIGSKISNNASTNTITASSGTINLAGSTVQAQGGGTAINRITASVLNANGAKLQITGNGYSSNKNILQATSTANLVFSSISVADNSNNANELTIGGGSLQVTDGISAYSGTNSITSAANNTFSSISGNGGVNQLNLTGDSVFNGLITANGGSNYISVQKVSFNSSIMAGNGGNTGTNKILFGGETTFDSNFVIKAANTINTNTNKTNIVKFDTGSSLAGNNQSISELTTASVGTNSNDLKKTSNILSFDELGTPTNLSIGYINNSGVVGSYSTGYNYIGKSLATGDSVNTLALNTSFTDSTWASNTYQASSLNLTITNDIYAKYGKNYINVSSLSVGGEIDGNAGTNNIATTTFFATTIKSRWGGANNIVVSGDATISGNIIAGDNDSTGTNMVAITNAGNAKIGEAQAVKLLATSTKNIISLDSGTSNVINLTSITSGTGGNYIAKDILSGADTGALALNNSITLTTFMSDAQAFVGKLAISEGISGNNAISYKSNSTSNVTSTLIQNIQTSEDGTQAFGTAISGSNAIYLNISDSGIGNGIEAIQTYFTSVKQDPNAAYTTLAGSAVIAGDIVNSGSTNVKVVGTQKTSTDEKAQIGLLGNIYNTSGTANIVLEDTFFAPSEMIVTASGKPYGVSANSLSIPVPVGGEHSGNITTASGAITNVVTRFMDKSPNGSGYSIYNVDNQGSGVTNIILQGNFQVGANVNYGQSYDGQVNMVFAAGNTGNSSFEAGSTHVDQNQILGLTYTNGLKLTLQDKQIAVGDDKLSFLGAYGHYFTSINNGKTSTFTLDRTDAVDTINIRGIVLGTIAPLQGSTAKSFDVTISENSAYVGSVALPASQGQASTIELTMHKGSKLLTDNDVFYVKKLELTSDVTFTAGEIITDTFAQSNTIIDMATMGSDLGNVVTRDQFRLFAVGVDGTTTPSSANTGLQGKDALFRVYVNAQADQAKAKLAGIKQSGTTGNFYGDRIVIADIGAIASKQDAQNHYLQVIADNNTTDLWTIHYDATANADGKGGTAKEGNIAVATVKNDTTNINKTENNQTQAVVVFNSQDVIQGFDQVATGLTAVETDQYGMTGTGANGWTTYFVNTMYTKGASEATQEATASAFATNYDLYLANFNSLNKRMGELRDNANSQGVWARVFSGAQSNDFSKSKSTYTTIQGGYDYALGFEGANNYIGLAVSYSMSSSKSDLNAIDINGSARGIEDIKSSAVEVAVYNSYVQDEGWYNDTIAKFSYIMSDFKMIGQNSTYSTNNMAFTLSDEFGYRFKLGEAREWYIDPQLEIGFGYFNQSDFVQTLGLSSLEGVAESIYTTRARLGSSFGYDFKKFTENKPIKASVYVGAFYEYDYITGGDISLTTNLGGKTTNASAISSDGRVVVNVGTNMTVKENTRIYFDFETSFAGKIRTDYQANVGVRYSFGENLDYSPINENTRVSVPLKVSDENAKEGEESQESVENTQEGTQATTSEQTSEASKESANSKDNKTEESTEVKSEEKTDSKSEEKAQ